LKGGTRCPPSAVCRMLISPSPTRAIPLGAHPDPIR
jgi:hypothetical protein